MLSHAPWHCKHCLKVIIVIYVITPHVMYLSYYKQVCTGYIQPKYQQRSTCRHIGLRLYKVSLSACSDTSTFPKHIQMNSMYNVTTKKIGLVILCYVFNTYTSVRAQYDKVLYIQTVYTAY